MSRWRSREDRRRPLVYSSTQHPDEVQHLVAEAIRRSGERRGVYLPADGWRVRWQGKPGRDDRLHGCADGCKDRDVPCKLRLDRDDDMIMTGKRHDFVIDYEAGFRRLTGRIRGIGSCWPRAAASRRTCRARSTIARCFTATMRTSSKTLRSRRTAARRTRSRTRRFAVSAVRRACSQSSTLSTTLRGISARTRLDVRRRNFYGIGERDTTQYGQKVEDNILAAFVRSAREQRRLSIAARSCPRVQPIKPRS